MRVIVFFREMSEHGRTVETFLGDFRRQTGRELEQMNPDSKEGSDLARVYDIVEYPTVVALNDEGQLQYQWRGIPMPTISEVSYYVQ